MKATTGNDLSTKYSKTTILIHWVSFLLIMALLPLGFIMARMENDGTKLILMRAHILIGLLVFALTLLRVWSFFKHKRPSRLQTGSRLHERLIVWIENSFYFILILLSTSGIATVVAGGIGEAIRENRVELLPQSYDIPPLMAHRFLAIVLVILLIGHVGGVINHYIKAKENTLKRITP